MAMNGVVRRLALPGALAVGLGVAATAAEIVRDPLPDLRAQAVLPPGVQPAGAEQLSTAFRAASRGALPAVVYVEVESVSRGGGVPEQFRGTPMEGFFGPRSAPAPQKGSGSGFIISEDGYILTNNHVVDGASRVTVRLADRRELSARVVGRDPNTDVAVIKVEAQDLPVARLGDSDLLQTGDWVLALGYPLSLGQTTTAGIVSAKGRSIGIMQQNEGATAPLEHFIQTDAAINPGNSGGPLVDLQGRVIGINSAIASPTGFYSGYGFAVPINLARRVADDLIRYGVVHRPVLGVQIRSASPADAEVFRLPAPSGAVVVSEPTGPAQAAGIEMGDVIVAVEGQAVTNDADLMELLARKQPGERATVELVRYGARKRVEVKLGKMDIKPLESGAPAAPARDPVARLGFNAVDVDPAFAARHRLPFQEGVVVTEVDRGGPAAGVLMGGVRVERLNGREVRSVADVRAEAARLKPGQVVSVVARAQDGRRMILNYKLRG
jgi:serine protease Do